MARARNSLWMAALAALMAGVAAPGAAAAMMRAQRIVSLAPSVTETLFALGAGAEVAGVSEYCDYPPEARRLPRVGSFLTPNLEAIVALHPTVVIGLSLSSERRQVKALNSMGIETVLVSDHSLEEIYQSIATIGGHVGRRDEARALLAEIRARMNAVQARIAQVAPVRTLMLVGHQPVVAVGPGTYLGELIAIARGDNIASRSGQAWPRLSIEYIIAMRPEVILDGQMGSEPGAPPGFWTKYATIPAVREHRVYGYSHDPILHPGPRVWQSLEIIATRLHPRAMAAGPAP